MRDLRIVTASAANPAGRMSRRHHSTRLRNTLRHCALVAALAFGIGAADAHAMLDHAEPRVGNTVRSPHIVSLWFTQKLESGFSTIEVLDASGTPMNDGKAMVDSGDRKLLRVPVKALPAGTYTVKWHVLSVDTHTSEGNFTFRVSP